MSWVRLDDRYDDARKIRRAWRRDRGAVGTHIMATTHSARHESNGLVDHDWLEELIPLERERKKTLEVLIGQGGQGLFRPLPKGETVSVEDMDGNEVVLGPLEEDAYIINDFLEFNPSSVQLESKRKRDRVRKDSARNPNGNDGDSTRTSHARVPAPAGAGPGRDGRGRVDQDSPPSGFDHKLVARAASVLKVLDAIFKERGGHKPTLRGVSLALQAYPARDHLAVVRELEHWALAGNGQNVARSDWVKTYRTFLGNAVDGAPTRAGRGRTSRTTSAAEMTAALNEGAVS